MAGRPKIFNEQEAVEKASHLFWKKGYEATSTEDLINVMGLQRGSFYHSFGSKKQLFLNAIDLHETKALIEFRKILKESANPVAVIKAMFVELAKCSPEEHRKGCFAGNTIAELSDVDEELATNAKNHLKALEQIFFEQIKLCQEKKLLKTKTDAKILARYLLNFWNGINITRRIYQSKKELILLIECQFEILK